VVATVRRGRVRRVGCRRCSVSSQPAPLNAVREPAQSTSLTRLETACRLLAEARSVDEVRSIRDVAEAARVYAREVRLGLEAQNDAAEINLRAERRLGELLADAPLQNGGDAARARSHAATEVRPRLRDLGISKSQSSRWQALAAVPDRSSIARSRVLVIRSPRRLDRAHDGRCSDRCETVSTAIHGAPIHSPFRAVVRTGWLRCRRRCRVALAGRLSRFVCHIATVRAGHRLQGWRRGDMAQPAHDSEIVRRSK
jgi:hypothetical protein